MVLIDALFGLLRHAGARLYLGRCRTHATCSDVIAKAVGESLELGPAEDQKMHSAKSEPLPQ